MQGSLVGSGAILPGVSGGVLCAAFGIYEPIMDFLAHPIKGFRRHIRLLIPVIIGGLIGFVGLAKLLDLLLSANALIAVALFAGLIAGTFPSLAHKSVEEKPKNGWIGFILALFLSFVCFSSLVESGIKLEANFGWYIFCGAIWAFSMVIPGLSSSSILLFLGLYHAMDRGIGDLNPWVILPLIIGFVPTLLASAKPVNFLLKRYYPYFSKTVLGFMLSSLLVMMLDKDVRPTKFDWSIPVAVLCFAVGFALALWMGYLIAKKEATEACEDVEHTPEALPVDESAVVASNDCCEDTATSQEHTSFNEGEPL